MTSKRYDAIVVGGGHNGLAAGAYLAKNGANVVVLEKRWKTGGATDTSAPWPEHPDYRVTTYSYVTGMIPSKIVRDLRLTRHGYKTRLMGPVYQAWPDGRSMVFQMDDAKACYEEIAKFSKRDAEAVFAYAEKITTAAEVLASILVKELPKLDEQSALDPARLLWYLRRETNAGTAAEISKLMMMSATDVLGEWFESEQLRGVLTPNSVIGMWQGPDEPGSGFALVFESTAKPGDGGRGDWAHAEGGMGAVADAFRGAAESFGCEIRTEASVERVLVRNGRARGVVLEGGIELFAPVVVTACHPKITFLQQIDRGELPEDFVQRIEQWKSRSGDVKINLALSELPDFLANPNPRDGGVPRHLTGSVELALSPRYVEQAFRDAKAGRPAERPFVEGVIPTVFDKTLAPEGVHIMSLHTQWVPCEWVSEPHRDELQVHADRVVDLYTELAPNFKSSIIERQVIGPYDMEQELGLIGGNAYHGELTADQFFHMRPAPGYADYRTPIRGLYQCSSATHGGGGVNAIPAHNCVERILKDRAADRVAP